MRLFTNKDVVKWDEEELQKLYEWVDEIPLSRPKRNLTRDFSDGVLMAEVIKHYIPGQVELHNYAPSSGTRQKEANWYLLNRKVLSHLEMELSSDVISMLATCKPWAAESLLIRLRDKIDVYLTKSKAERHRPRDRGDHHLYHGDRPEADQGHLYNVYTPTYVPDFQHSGSGRHERNPSQNSMGRSQSLQNVARRPEQYPPYAGAGADLVPKTVLSDKDHALREREQTIEVHRDRKVKLKMLTTKVKQLEHLLYLKDMRIDDLSKRIEQYTSVTSYPGGSYSPPGGPADYPQPDYRPAGRGAPHGKPKRGQTVGRR